MHASKKRKLNDERIAKKMKLVPEEELMCAICHETLSYPVKMKCGCTFCARCIIAQYRSSMTMFKYEPTKTQCYPTFLMYKGIKCALCRLASSDNKPEHIGAEPESMILTRITAMPLIDYIDENKAARYSEKEFQIQNQNYNQKEKKKEKDKEREKEKEKEKEKDKHACQFCGDHYSLRAFTKHVLQCGVNKQLSCPSCCKTMRLPSDEYEPKFVSEEMNEILHSAGNNLNRIWCYHIDHDCDDIFCNQCDWRGSSKDWKLHLELHTLFGRMRTIGDRFESHEENKEWQGYVDDCIYRIPGSRIDIFNESEEEGEEEEEEEGADEKKKEQAQQRLNETEEEEKKEGNEDGKNWQDHSSQGQTEAEGRGLIGRL